MRPPIQADKLLYILGLIRYSLPYARDNNRLHDLYCKLLYQAAVSGYQKKQSCICSDGQLNASGMSSYTLIF